MHVKAHLRLEGGRQPAISSLIDLQHPERMCTPVQLDSSFFFYLNSRTQSFCK